MFKGKLTVEVSDENYDVAQKKVKAFQKLGTRHSAVVKVESFGGDSFIAPAPEVDNSNQ